MAGRPEGLVGGVSPSSGFRPDGTWRNWAGNQVARPDRIERPRTEEEASALVRLAAAEGRRGRGGGGGRAVTAIAVTDDVLVTLDDPPAAGDIDRGSGLVRGPARQRPTALNPPLHAPGPAGP
ncbi:MAG: hypothetical protein H8E59_00385, partial [Actinobacteria bacterium]|nr:hypothetical protein [Actinomycetota bacterium]